MKLEELMRIERVLIEKLHKAKPGNEQDWAIQALKDLYDMERKTRGTQVARDAEEKRARKLAKKPRKEPLTPTQKIDRKNDRRTAILDQRAKRRTA